MSDDDRPQTSRPAPLPSIYTDGMTGRSNGREPTRLVAEDKVALRRSHLGTVRAVKDLPKTRVVLSGRSLDEAGGWRHGSRSTAPAATRKSARCLRAAIGTLVRTHPPSRDFENLANSLGGLRCPRPPLRLLSGGLPWRRSPTRQTAGLPRTTVNVCKPDGEGTIAGTRGNGQVAPEAVIVRDVITRAAWSA
jgi:hypothetical protein